MSDLRYMYVTHRNFPRYVKRVASLAKAHLIPGHELERLLIEACGCIENLQKHIARLRGHAELMSKMASEAHQLEPVT